MAQTTISGWTLGSGNAADSTAYGFTFQNETSNVVTINAGTTKTSDSAANDVFVRRTGTGGNSNIWVTRAGGGNLRGMNPSTGDLGDVLLGNNLYQGGNDLFVNDAGTSGIATLDNNIERVDFYWTGGFTAVSDQGFAVFDRGRNDGFQIAVITGWNTSTNEATSFGGNVVEYTFSNANTNLGNFDATILRYATDTTLTTLDSSQQVNTQAMGGVFISFADLGIADGTRIYGYALMATDVTNTVANLVDWTNNSNYTQSTADTAMGSIDLAGVNGRRFVPEPTTYGAILMGGMIVILGFRRRYSYKPLID